MNKLFNWTFGSVFRTIGRVIGYLLVGALLGFILQKNGIKIRDLLPIMRVNALTLTSEVTKSGDGFFTLSNASSYDSLYSGYWKRVYNNDNIQSFDFTFDSALNTSDSDYVGFIIQYNQPLGTEIQEDLTMRYCSKWHLVEWTSRNNGEFGTMDTYQCQTYSSYNAGTDTYIEQQAVDNTNFYFRVYYENNGGWNSCFLNDTELVCPTSRKKIERLQIQVLFKAQHATSFNFGVQRGWNKYKSTSQEMIQEQQNTTNSVNNINDSINDDNVDSSSSQAGNFFSSFSTNTHGLTGIITAPLNAINSLTSATCSPLVLPLPFVNQNLTLPCMRQIYVDNFGGFMQIYDVIVIGIIAYWICVRIFGLVKDFKNPEHDEIEVVDL